MISFDIINVKKNIIYEEWISDPPQMGAQTLPYGSPAPTGSHITWTLTATMLFKHIVSYAAMIIV